MPKRSERYSVHAFSLWACPFHGICIRLSEIDHSGISARKGILAQIAMTFVASTVSASIHITSELGNSMPFACLECFVSLHQHFSGEM